MIFMKRVAMLAVLLAIALGIGLLLSSWSAENQVNKNMQTLFRLAGNKDWKRVERMVSDSYRDQWGQNKPQAMASCREFGQFFLTLEITGTGHTEAGGDSGNWRGKLNFSGRGTGVGELIFSRAGELTEDFVFLWRKENWKPWSWKLVSVSQSEIVFDSQWLQ